MLRNLDDRGYHPWLDPANRGMDGTSGQTQSMGYTAPLISSATSATTGAASGSGTADVPAFNYQTPAYSGPSSPQFNFPNVPQFHALPFNVPGAAGMYADPGYQFRLQQGLGALQASQAAKGLLRSGASYKGLEDYGQASASQEYQNVFQRALDAYNLREQGRKDEFAPRLLNYNNLFGAAQAGGLAGFAQGNENYRFGIDDEYRREAMLLQAQQQANATAAGFGGG